MTAPVVVSTPRPDRVLRLALACTGEYWKARGNSKRKVAAAIGILLQRLNSVYERDLGITFELAAGSDALWFDDPDNDPFTNDDLGALIEQSQQVIDDAIGAVNYELGHTLGTGGGGQAVAGIGNDCQKAMGVTGSTRPWSDAFEVSYVAHEIGHQLGARHTFNGSLGYCCCNHASVAAFEPGAGVTVMSYAGICEGDDYEGVGKADRYFHAGSVAEIEAKLRDVADRLPAEGGIGLELLPSPAGVIRTGGSPLLGPSSRRAGTYTVDLRIPLITPEPRDTKRLVLGRIHKDDGSVYLVDRPFSDAVLEEVRRKARQRPTPGATRDLFDTVIEGESDFRPLNPCESSSPPSRRLLRSPRPKAPVLAHGVVGRRSAPSVVAPHLRLEQRA